MAVDAPNCRSSNIEAYEDFDGCSQEAKCHDCGASWVDCYNLVGYTELEVPSKMDLHKVGMYVVIDNAGAPIQESFATTGYSARAEFCRSQNKLWSKAEAAGYRIIELTENKNATESDQPSAG